MQLVRAVGREAAARKYDILSALMVHALAEDKHVQRLVLRMMTLVTTRYNWQQDELSIGQEEIARLWSVDERTVKREMAKLRALGWFVVKRQGARGRVSIYGIDLARVMEDTRPAWPRIGADFVARVSPASAAEAMASNVVPLRPAVPAPEPAGTIWGAVQQRLHRDDPATYAVWFRALTEAGAGEGCLTLAAPTRFHASYVETHLKHRLLAALRETEPSFCDVRIIA